MAKIILDILNPEQFDTLQKIRDFVTGDGARALRYAIGDALCPAGAIDDVEVKLKNELKDAREAAFFVNNDLGVLAKSAIELEGDPDVSSNGAIVLDRERRALLFIALKEGATADPIQRGIIEYLADGSAGSLWLKAGGEEEYKNQRPSV